MEVGLQFTMVDVIGPAICGRLVVGTSSPKDRTTRTQKDEAHAYSQNVERPPI